MKNKLNDNELIKRILKSSDEADKVSDEVGYDEYLRLVKLAKEKIETQKRFEESIRHAREVGVPEEKILHNKEEIDNYFRGKES